LDWNAIFNEVSFRTSRSSGAGGQHVNKTESRVEVRFEVSKSSGLTDEEKGLVAEQLKARISDEGILSVTSQKDRSQFANKELALDRLRALLEKALVPKVKRHKTKPTKKSVEDRLQDKKLLSEKKVSRKKPGKL